MREYGGVGGAGGGGGVMFSSPHYLRLKYPHLKKTVLDVDCWDLFP